MVEEHSSEILRFLAEEPRWMKHPFFNWIGRNLWTILLLLTLGLFYGYFLAHTIDLTTADIGRHIRNGELLFTDPSVLSNNFYSYTEPEFAVTNHHWGSGLLLYLVWKVAGFSGLQIFFILLSVATLFVFLLAGKKHAGWGIAGMVTLVAIPLIAERTEIRPEVFSYLFAGVFFLLLSRFRDQPDAKNARLLWYLPMVMVLWVNTHILFLLGPLLLGAFVLEGLLVRRETFRHLLFVFGAVILGTTLNPFGYRAFLGAVSIFKNYGYRLAENQPVWFMEKFSSDPNFLIFKILFLALALSFILALYRNWRLVRLSNFCVAVGISVMAWFAIRNLALFGFVAIPLICSNVAIIFPSLVSRQGLTRIAVAFSVIGLSLSLLFVVPRFFPYWHEFGLGVETGNESAVEFLKKQHITGPIFNNYDIGGYLIFHLFPSERVFVDNRPEAYSVDFFEKTYIPMQEDEAVWQRELLHYQFNVIMFLHRDMTTWGQKFLISRIDDKEWAPVYVDGKIIIFLRRLPRNRKVIEEFEIPRTAFAVIPNP